MDCEPVVFIVDDESKMRRSLSRLLKSVGLQSQTFRSAEDFLQSHNPNTHGCLILDVRMDGLTGLELQAELSRRKISIPIIVISGYAEVRSVVQAVRGGAMDFLEKPFDDEMLLRAVREAIDEDRSRRAQEQQRQQIEVRIAELTPRELQVMDLLAAGKTTKQIGLALGISSKTADVHRARVLEKMKADGMVDLVRLLHQADVVS